MSTKAERESHFKEMELERKKRLQKIKDEMYSPAYREQDQRFKNQNKNKSVHYTGDEYDYLRDTYGKKRKYNSKEIASLSQNMRMYHVTKIYYKIGYNEREEAKEKFDAKWDPKKKLWYIWVADKGITWKSNEVFPVPNDLEKALKPFNTRHGIKYPVVEIDYYEMKNGVKRKFKKF